MAMLINQGIICPTAFVLLWAFGAVAASGDDTTNDKVLTWRLSEAAPPSGTLAWDKPASAAFTLNDDDTDSVAVHANIRVMPGTPNDIWSGKLTGRPYGSLAWDRNSIISDPQNNLKAGVGYEFSTTANYNDPCQATETTRCDNSYHAFAAEAAYNRKIEYGDSDATPPEPNQEIESLLLTFAYAPVLDKLIGKSEENTPPIFAGLIPSTGFYYDNIFHNKVDENTGIAKTGTETGVYAKLSFKAFPKKMKHFELNVTGQVRIPFNQTGTRDDNASGLVEVTFNYFPFNPKGASATPVSGSVPKLRPGISVSFKHGKDPLVGLKRQSYIMFSFTLGHF